MNIMARLKAETTEYHTKIEALPFFVALGEQRLPFECYIRQLRALAIIHATLEREISTAEDDRLRTVWHDDLRKVTLLLTDIADLESAPVWDSVPVVETALLIGQRIRARCAQEPASLLGDLYVLEGMTLGNAVHRGDVAATYRLDGNRGGRYYASYGVRLSTAWTVFSQRMNHALVDAALHKAVVAAAHETFSGLTDLYSALYPSDGQRLCLHVTRVNPEAGTCPIPQNEVEVNAALHASQDVWDAFAYFAARYGERGKRFSDSDACWLVTLAELDQDVLQQQVEWLGRVLATRGIPRITLEQTLYSLHQALTEARSDHAARYDKLLQAAKALRKCRLKAIPGWRFEMLAARFEEYVGSTLVEMHRGTGRLLLSAVADELNGVDGAVSALVDWLTDAKRFPAHWIATVERTVADARTAQR